MPAPSRIDPPFRPSPDETADHHLFPPEASVPVRLASLESTFHSAPIGLCTVDLNFRYIIVNKCFASMYDQAPDHFIGRTVSEALPGPAPQIIAHYKHVLEARTIVEHEIHVLKPGLNPDDKPREKVYLRSAQPIFDPSGTILGISVALLDVTERRQIESALRESEENLRYTVQLTPHIPWTANANGDITFMSPRWYQVTGIRPSAALLRNWILGLHHNDRKQTLEIWKECIATGRTFDTEYRVRCLGDQWRWHRARAYPRLDDQGKVILWYGTVEDIHDRKVAEAALLAKTIRLEEVSEKLAQLAREDHLTGLANRRTFDDMLGKEVDRARRSTLPLALILADVDHFKHFNDTYGHPAGDDVLRAVAQAIDSVLRRPGDLAARFGGEEFTVILPNTNRPGALVMAEKIRAAVSALLFTHPDTAPHGVTISLGVAMLPIEYPMEESRDTITETFIATADKALYRAKAAGRNCTVFA